MDRRDVITDEERASFRQPNFRKTISEEKAHTCWSRRSKFEKSLSILLGIVVVALLIVFGVLALRTSLETTQDMPMITEETHLQESSPSPRTNEEKAIEIQQQKVEDLRNNFAERFPRSASEAPNSIPLPLSYYRRGNLSLEEKIDEIFESFDGDSNNEANPWELHDWIVWVDKIVYNNKHETQWSFFQKNGNLLAWTDYLYQTNPNRVQNQFTQNDLHKKERRWKAADQNGDTRLSKEEFKLFLFPQLNDEVEGLSVLVHEGFENLDMDSNGQVSKHEFLIIHHPNATARMDRYFDEVLDRDQNGYLTLDEIAIWVKPDGFIPAKSEVIYLMEKLDNDRNKQLSKEEVLIHPNIFINSQVTFFEDIYRSENLRSQVFRYHY